MPDRLVKDLLTRVPIFHGLPLSQMRAFLEICKLMTLPQGSVLCEYGSPSKQFFILLEGELDILARDGTRITSLRPVQTVGEMGLVSKRPRAATVRATSAARLLEISFPRFDAFLEAHPEVGTRLYRNFVRVLAERLSDTNDMAARYKRLYEEATGQARSDAPHSKTPATGEARRAAALPPPARDHVSCFYELLQRLPGETDITEGERIVAELRDEGFSDADIEFATRWTARHIPGARRFDMVKLSIQEALEDKWSI